MIALAIYITSLKSSLFIVAVLMGVGLFLWQLMGRMVADLNNRPFNHKAWPFLVWVPLLAASVLIPSRETAMLMFAGHVVEQVATSDRAVGIADNSLAVIEKMMGEYLNETK